MGHLAAGPTELREAVSPGALEKDSPDMGGPPPPAEGTEAGISYLVCLLLKGRGVLGAGTKGRGHTGWWQQGHVFSSRGPQSGC